MATYNQLNDANTTKNNNKFGIKNTDYNNPNEDYYIDSQGKRQYTKRKEEQRELEKQRRKKENKDYWRSRNGGNNLNHLLNPPNIETKKTTTIIGNPIIGNRMLNMLNNINNTYTVEKDETKYDDKQTKAEIPTYTVAQLDEVNADKIKEKADAVKNTAKDKNANRTGATPNTSVEPPKKKNFLEKMGLTKDKINKIAGSSLSNLMNNVVSKALGGLGVGNLFQFQSLDEWKEFFGEIKSLGKKKKNKTGSISDNTDQIKNSKKIKSKTKKADNKKLTQEERRKLRRKK